MYGLLLPVKMDRISFMDYEVLGNEYNLIYGLWSPIKMDRISFMDYEVL